MKLLSLEKKDDLRVEAILEGCSLEFVNSIRRAILEFVPTYAVDLVVCEKNTTLLNDDIFQDGLYMLPISLKDEYSDKTVDLNESCEFMCSGAESKEGNYVTMSSKDHIQSTYFKSDYDCEINQLFDGNMEIKGEFYVSKGSGKEHSKFCPVSLITFEPLDTTVDDDECMKWKLIYDSVRPHHQCDIFFDAIRILKSKFHNLKRKLKQEFKEFSE